MLAGMVVPTDTTITLPAGLNLDDKTFTADEGARVTVDGVGDFKCLSATCTVVVENDVITTTGLIEVVSLVDDLPAEVLTALADVAQDPLTDLAMAQLEASNAADAAMKAAGTAKASADDADKARANAATIQTNAMSGSHAKMARSYATKAQTAYMTAKTESDAAADATTVLAAVNAQVKAQIAMAHAVTARDDAAEHADLSMKAAATELLIVDKTKSVGETYITIDGLTVDNAATGQETGLIADMELTAMGGAGASRPHTVGMPNTDVPAAPVLPVGLLPTVAAREVDIGITYDSKADDARLTLVTSYLTDQTVGVFQNDGTPLITEAVDEVDLGEADNPDIRALHAASGTYLHVGAGDGNGDVAETDTVMDDTKPTQLWYYVTDMVDNPNTVDRDESKQFVSQTGTGSPSGGTTTYDYQPVDVVGGVKIAVKADFLHLHYGLWNALTPGTKTTGDAVADLGIGFVTAQGTSSMTEEMPTIGDATYTGNWVANIQAAATGGDGLIQRSHNDAEITADFTKGTVGVDLTGLADLTGAISGNTFAGTAITVDAAPMGQLGQGTKAGAFTGTFNGGFFGDLAAEAGGVFDYSSTGNKLGAFRGSFGGAAE